MRSMIVAVVSEGKILFCGCCSVCKENLSFWRFDHVRTFARPVCATDKGRCEKVMRVPDPIL